MRWRPLMFMATVGFVIIAWASPAMAKGPDQATITGPGLDKPVVVTGFGEPGSGDKLGELADGSGLFLVMFGSDGSARTIVSEAPTGDLGPKFQLSYRVPDGTEAGSTVRQDLYPAGGRWTGHVHRPGPGGLRHNDERWLVSITSLVRPCSHAARSAISGEWAGTA